MSNYQRVKVIVAGDSGVGKTAFVNLLCYNKVLTNPNWTIGSQVEIKLHDYNAGTPTQVNYCVELWDIGGYKNHTNSRSVFYSNTDGIILVYDITNKKSENNLDEWVNEIMKCNPESSQERYQDDSSLLGSYLGDSFGAFSTNSDWFQRVVTTPQLPVLVVGTNIDQIRASESQIIEQRHGNFAQVHRYEEIILSNMLADSLAPGCSNSVILDQFFDRVISSKIRNQYQMDISRPLNIDNYSSKRHTSIRIDQ